MNDERTLPLPHEDEPSPGDLAAARGELSLPRDPRSLLLTGIFVLLVFYTLYFASEIFLPVCFAVLLKLLLQPLMRVLCKLRLPKPIAALTLIIALCSGLSGLAYVLAGPSVEWLAKVPRTLPQLEQRLHVLKKPIDQVQQATKQVEKITESSGASEPTPVTVKGPGLADWLMSGTRSIVTGTVTTLLLLFFLLLAGDLFLRRLVEILPRLSNKKQAVDISNEIERNISAYLLTITVMNAAVGAATGIVFHLIGMEDAILWGSVAFVLNYIPILGPLCGIGLFTIVGITIFDSTWHALLPAGLYFLIHVVEGEAVTPMLLARRFTLNPVLVIGSLVFWHWMWGIPGTLLAVPMLAVFKIVCDRVRPLMALGHFIGGESTSSLVAPGQRGTQRQVV
jgi:predicted PurR-regulated permease PerM